MEIDMNSMSGDGSPATSVEDGAFWPARERNSGCNQNDSHIKEMLSPLAAALENGVKASDANAQPTKPDDDPTPSQTDIPDLTMNLRSYQREMFEKSLHRNVIVTMDTGTGKTRVAVLRIQSELEQCNEDQLVWFLAPKVALCAQQFDAIKKLIPAAPATLLTGNENDGTWKANTWRKVLASTRIVVSTPEILRDALSHAFITLDSLALLILDEAHNATKQSPFRRIMLDFYNPRRAQGLHLPSILGLTASPSMNSTKDQLVKLEQTLDAVCIAPTIHREELLQHANRPSIRHVVYEPTTVGMPHTDSMRSVQQICADLDIETDPYILKLKAEPTERNLERLQKAFYGRNTWSQTQLRGLMNRSEVVLTELGSWAANRYIWMSVSGLMKRTNNADTFFDASWLDDEKVYVAQALASLSWEQPPEKPQNDSEVSEKVQRLVQTLLSKGGKRVGIIFVRDRVIVMMLKEVLSANALVSARYRIGTQVGANTGAGKARELFEFKDRNNSLAEFTSGEIDLMVATSVLEEGIDVPACNLVVSFNVPSNAKAFIQQRGRARKHKSELILFFENTTKSHLEWTAAEEEMRQLYENDARERVDLKTIEDSETSGDEVYVVSTTGARLDYDSSKQHLNHFCAVLSRGDYVDAHPDYIIHQNPETGGLSATVILPSFVASDLRRAESSRSWKSERNATKDAAFQAYKALHQAGWLNDNLLPFRTQGNQSVETRDAIVEVEELLRPWHSIARLWQMDHDLWKYPLSYHDGQGAVIGTYDIILPIEVSPPAPIRVFLSSEREQLLHLGIGSRLSGVEYAQLPDHTSTLLALHFKHRWSPEEQAHVLRVISNDGDMTMNQIGAQRFEDCSEMAQSREYLVRDRDGYPFIYEGVIPSKPELEEIQFPFLGFDQAPDDVPYLNLKNWTKRSDFLHRIPAGQGKEKLGKAYQRVMPMTWALVDSIPLCHAEFGMLLPSVMHEIEIMLIVRDLHNTLLKDIGISNKELIREAISARSASEPYHYERLEFLGDSILKYCTSVQIAADHTDWPEGYLTFEKDKIVANSRLSRAALQKGLSRFILTRPFTSQKWRPLYLTNMLEPPPEAAPRTMSTKTLADVVEALIGASYADGGLPKALKCISTFIDDINWRDVPVAREIILRAARKDDKRLGVVAPVQKLIEYEFKTTSLLLEALTHASYVADSDLQSFERLEFLGDSVLDYIIVTKLYKAEPRLGHAQMHMLKTALVNGDFLAYVALEHRLTTTHKVATVDGQIEEEKIEKPLWMFMRHTSPGIAEEQKAMDKRFEKMRDELQEALNHGTHYPWALLARLQAKKLFSDLVEALLGAVWTDSGSIAQCEIMLTHFGIIPYLERMLRDKVHVQHPKEELMVAAGSQEITYAVDVHEHGDGEREWLCRILTGENRVIADVKGGVTREEVKIKAAAEALVFLKQERDTAA